MATAYPMDTPSRVLRRVQEMEDADLPSLPSIHHDFDYDTESASEAGTSLDRSVTEINNEMSDGEESDMATPHPLRQSYVPKASTSYDNDIASDPSSMGSPFPPRDDSGPSPYAPSAAATSTPNTVQSRQSRSNLAKTAEEHAGDRSGDAGTGMERTRSARSLKSSSGTAREQWHTPGEMSRSFSGDEIRSDAEYDGLGDEKSIPLNDTSLSRKYVGHAPLTETPYTRRLSNGHVLHQRPGRRATSGNFQPIGAGKALSDLSPLSSQAGTASTPHSTKTALHIPTAGGGRLPSLTHSEQSMTDASEPAGTPEGPSREVAVQSTPSRAANSSLQGDSESAHGTPPGIEENDELELPSLPVNEVTEEFTQTTVASPVKAMSFASLSTPGVGRLQSPQHMSGYYQQFTQSRSPSHEPTTSQKNSPLNIPFTPSPGAGHSSRGSDFSTPRAPLDDAERRKNHVLAVLSSSEMPSRKTAIRRTPHPLRRVSNAMTSDDGSPALYAQSATFRSQSETIHLGDGSRTQTANESFVSIASSNDLTSDHRASRSRVGFTRANTSFPTILLPTGNASSGSLKGLSEARADGVKIHRHLNAMNKQLLETNAGLAREAEAWRDEVDRLANLLRQADVDFEEVDVLANLSVQIDQADKSGLSAIPERLRERPRHSSGAYNALHEQPDVSSSELPPMSDLLTQALSRYDHNQQGDKSRVEVLVNPEDNEEIFDELVHRYDMLEEKLGQKDTAIEQLQRELEVAQGFGSHDSDVTQTHQLQVEQLKQSLEKAEEERASIQAAFAQKTEEHAKKFGEICTGFEEQVTALQVELDNAKSEVERLRAEKERLETLSERDSVSEREAELRDQLAETQVKLRAAEESVQARSDEIEDLRIRLASPQEDHAECRQRVDEAQTQLEESRERIRELEQKFQESAHSHTRDEGDQEAESPGLRSINAQLEEELDQQDKEIQELSDRLTELQAELDTALDERDAIEEYRVEVERLNNLVAEIEDELAEKDGELEVLRGKQSLAKSINSIGDDGKVEEMELHLAEAFKEIGRLKHELASSPHRKSAIEMRDMRIQSLEREKALLQERLAGARDASTMSALASASVTGVKTAASPFKSTPFLRKALAGAKTPLTPGPMMEMSWLQTTMGDSHEPVIRAQMEYLQKELDAANNQLDANFSKLEAAGLNGLSLAEKLAKAEDRVSELEDALRVLSKKDKASMALVEAQKDDQRHSEARLKDALRGMTTQLDALKADYKAEQDRLQGDNVRLRDFVTEVRAKSDAKFHSTVQEFERLQEENEAELRRAKQAQLEAEDKAEMAQKELRASAAKIRQLERELSDQRVAQLERQAAHADDARGPTISDTGSVKVRHLEQTLETTRQEAERLKVSLEQRTEALSIAEDRLASLKRERQANSDQLTEFQRDLRAQRTENAEFGRELRRFKEDQEDSIHRHRRELESLRLDLRTARDDLRRSERDLVETKAEYQALRDWKRSHDCGIGTTKALEEQKSRFKAQSRELAVQVRYLKAKFTREATFRNALAIQKRYLLLLVGGYSLNEQAILKQIASMGYPVPEGPRPRRTLKAVATAIQATIRARNSARNWRTERRIKNDAVLSYTERKREVL